MVSRHGSARRHCLIRYFKNRKCQRIQFSDSPKRAPEDGTVRIGAGLTSVRISSITSDFYSRLASFQPETARDKEGRQILASDSTQKVDIKSSEFGDLKSPTARATSLVSDGVKSTSSSD